MSLFRTQVTMVPIADVKPNEKNAKIHNREQIDALKVQFKAHGFDVIPVVDPQLVVIKGHGRLEAIKELDAEGEISDHLMPVIVRSDLSSEQVRAARIADNKLAESKWNVDLLALEVKELHDLGVKVELTGLTLGELRSLTEPAQGSTKPGSTELSEGDFQKFDNKCPSCGFEFNTVKT